MQDLVRREAADRVFDVDPIASMNRQAQRSFEAITEEQLARLVELSDEDRDRLPPEWQARRAGVFLAQGAAQHFVDGRHGVKDFDVWTFYWADDQT